MYTTAIYVYKQQQKSGALLDLTMDETTTSLDSGARSVVVQRASTAEE